MMPTASSCPIGSQNKQKGIRNLRWWIARLLALATALNYLDRQSFPVVVGEIRKEIPLTDNQYTQPTSLFLLAYAVCMPVGAVCSITWAREWAARKNTSTSLPQLRSRSRAPQRLRRRLGFGSSLSAMFGHQFWSSNVQTLPADIFPARVVGSVEGLLGCAGSFGGMLFGLLVGNLIGQHGYAPAFLLAGLFTRLAFC
jgi:sugar phosphate permease